MLYVTGDTHADIERFKTKEFKKLKKTDTVVVLGDFGFLWDNSKEEEKNLKWLSKRRYKILFLDGSYDNYDMLSEYAYEPFCGGMAQQITKNIYHLRRGDVYILDNLKVLCFGGADSVAGDDRVEGQSWWRSELPDAGDLSRALENIDKYNGEFDYVLTHESPLSLLTFINLHQSDAYIFDKTNSVQTFLDMIKEKIDCKCWLFGCHHRDVNIGKKAISVYTKLVNLI